MPIPKITQKEYDRFVDQELINERFSKHERDVLRSVVTPHLRDRDFEERRTFFDPNLPGVTEKELPEIMEVLRNPHSDVAKGLKITQIPEPKLDKFEEVMKKALKENREPLW